MPRPVRVTGSVYLGLITIHLKGERLVESQVEDEGAQLLPPGPIIWCKDALLRCRMICGR